MKQTTMRCLTLLFVLAIYLDVTTINCHFNPFMDSEYFSIDWAGRETSKPDDVRDISTCLFLHSTTSQQMFKTDRLELIAGEC